MFGYEVSTRYKQFLFYAYTYQGAIDRLTEMGYTPDDIETFIVIRAL